MAILSTTAPGERILAAEAKSPTILKTESFDRFGLFSIHNDGGHAPVKIWFDDLKYSASRIVTP